MATDFRYTIRMPAELGEALTKLAEAHDRSLNRELVRALQVWATMAESPTIGSAMETFDRTGPERDIASMVDILSTPDVQAAIEAIAQPSVQETLKRLQRLDESPLGLSSSTFARDWDSDEDSVYDDLNDGDTVDNAGDDGVQ
jgi:hypothetical protein